MLKHHAIGSAAQIAANKVSSRLIFYNKNDLFLAIGPFENKIFENKKIYIQCICLVIRINYVYNIFFKYAAFVSDLMKSTLRYYLCLTYSFNHFMQSILFNDVVTTLLKDPF